jgi:flavorubredoxin
MVLCASSYDGGVMPLMRDFICHLADKTYQKRTVALVENGTWAPSAARTMRALLEPMKEVTILEQTVTIKTTLNDDSHAALKQLAAAL